MAVDVFTIDEGMASVRVMRLAYMGLTSVASMAVMGRWVGDGTDLRYLELVFAVPMGGVCSLS